MADMVVLKAIVSLYRAGEEKHIERYKTMLKVAVEKKNIIEFLGLNERAQKFSLGSFDLKFFRLTKINGKEENYAISNDTAATRASTADFNQVEEYESDSDGSDNDVDIESEVLVIRKPIMTRCGRQVKVWTRFDV